jgi:hypothetical protein
MIKITSKKEGFRRCGVAHPKGVAEYPDNRFTEAELLTLANEPMLTVELTETAAEKAGAMMKKDLMKKTVEELTALLKEMSVSIPDGAKKADLAELIMAETEK